MNKKCELYTRKMKIVDIVKTALAKRLIISKAAKSQNNKYEDNQSSQLTQLMISKKI